MMRSPTAWFITLLILNAPILLAYDRLAVGSATAIEVPTSVARADVACAKCHRGIYDNYLKTPMANASGVAEDRWLPGSFHQQRANVEYRFFQEDGASWMGYSRPGDPSLSGRFRLKYFLGSGHLGLTYLYSTNGYLFETPAAYYANLQQSYDMKPGLSDGPRMPPGLPMTTGCLRCHMSAVREADAGTENHFSGLPFQHGGITCEGCHGATDQHVASRGRAAVVNPIKLDAERRDSVCINCHLEGDTNVERYGKHATDYKPGEKISDYLAFFEYTSINATARGVSEIEQFSQSKCKQMSGDRMSCMNCHDPHFSPTVEDRGAFYRGKCLRCHTAAKYATAHFPATADCTACHMPKGGAENIPHVAWTDHRILRQPATRTNINASDNLELVSILKDGGTERDQALAYYDLVTNGHGSERQRALALLKRAAKSAQDDPQIFLALGVMLQWSKDVQGAMEAYRRVLRIDSLNMTAAVNLGTLLAQSGQLQPAADLWTPAFTRNQDNVTLGTNLAIVECLLGRKEDARDTLKTVLLYSPDEERSMSKLRSIESEADACTERTRN